MKKISALLLVLAMVLLMTACNTTAPEKEEDDDLVTVWLLTSETSYEADGSRGYTRTTYSYTDDGLLLSEELDRGLSQEEWNEEQFVYMTKFFPYDDTLDQKYEFFYNEQGDLLYYSEYRNIYDDEGLLIESQEHHYGKDDNITYHYDMAGKIETIDYYPRLIDGGHGDEVYAITHCEYDEAGNLIEVWSESLQTDRISWNNDYRYDEEGRLIASVSRYMDGAHFYWYEYNDAGQLTRMSQATGYSQMPLDDDHISKATEAPKGQATTDLADDRSEVRFEYDVKGHLTARKYYTKDGELTRTDTCAYQDGKLSTLTYYCDDEDGPSKYIYVDDEKDASPDAVTLVRDENGNIAKVIRPDGSYVELEYKKFQLTQEQAQKSLMTKYAFAEIDPAGRKYHYIDYTYGTAYELYRPMLTTAFYEVDVIKQDLDRR